MAEKKEYRSAVRSRKMIQEAFMKLLEQKDISKISVTDIVKMADINRSTFYAHYQDIFALYEDLMQNVIRCCLESLEKDDHSNIMKEPQRYLRTITATLEEYRHLYRKLGHSEDIHRILDIFRQQIVEDITLADMLPEKVRVEPLYSIRIHFFVGGIMNTYQQWLEGKLTCSLEEINVEIGELIVKSLEELLHITDHSDIA